MYILLFVLIMWETLKEHRTNREFWKCLTGFERGKSEQLMSFSAEQGIFNHF